MNLAGRIARLESRTVREPVGYHVQERLYTEEELRAARAYRDRLQKAEALNPGAPHHNDPEVRAARDVFRRAMAGASP